MASNLKLQVEADTSKATKEIKKLESEISGIDKAAAKASTSGSIFDKLAASAANASKSMPGSKEASQIAQVGSATTALSSAAATAAAGFSRLGAVGATVGGALLNGLKSLASGVASVAIAVGTRFASALGGAMMAFGWAGVGLAIAAFIARALLSAVEQIAQPFNDALAAALEGGSVDARNVAGLQALGQVLTGDSEAAKAFAAGIVNMQQTMVKGGKDADALVAALKDIKIDPKQLTSKNITEVSAAVEQLIAKWKTWSDAQKGGFINKAFPGAGGAAKAQIVQAFDAPTKDIADRMNRLGLAVENAMRSMDTSQRAAQSVRDFVLAINDLDAALGRLFGVTSAWDALKNKAISALDGIGAAVKETSRLIDVFNNAPPGDKWTAIGKEAEAGIATFNKSLGELGAEISSNFSKNMADNTKAFDDFIGLFTVEKFSAAKTAVTDAFAGISAAIATVFATIKATIEANVAEWSPTITAKMEEIKSTISTKAGEWAQALTDKLSSVTTAITGKISEWAAALVNGVGAMKDAAAQLGQAIYDGIINAISNLGQAIVDKVSSGVAAAVAKIKGMFGGGAASEQLNLAPGVGFAPSMIGANAPAFVMPQVFGAGVAISPGIMGMAAGVNMGAFNQWIGIAPQVQAATAAIKANTAAVNENKAAVTALTSTSDIWKSSLEQVVVFLNSQTSTSTQTTLQMQKLNEAINSQKLSIEGLKVAHEQLKAAQQKAGTSASGAADGMKNFMTGLESFAESAADALLAAAVSGEKLSDTLRRLLLQLAMMALRTLVIQPLFKSLFGGLGAGAPQGFYLANESYAAISGNAAGSFNSAVNSLAGISARAFRTGSTGGDTTITNSLGDMTVNFSTPGPDVAGDSEKAKQFSQQVRMLIQREMVVQSRPGGILRAA